jgi:hypothetical protein
MSPERSSITAVGWPVVEIDVIGLDRARATDGVDVGALHLHLVSVHPVRWREM